MKRFTYSRLSSFLLFLCVFGLLVQLYSSCHQKLVQAIMTYYDPGGVAPSILVAFFYFVISGLTFSDYISILIIITLIFITINTSPNLHQLRSEQPGCSIK